ncbi:MAG: VTT domain-containing protein [Candidatus Saccharibacteria bacterium]|nr:VTT domain-containing protein [Candidatus Saccharibacteria bacterium]
MESLIHAITGLGIAAVLLVVYAESGLLIGFVLPGDSLLFTAGYMVNQEILRLFGHPLNIHLFVAAIALMAILGDSTGYAFGRKVGRKLFLKPNSRFFKKKYLEQAEQFYQKHGSLTIVLARFVPVVRTFAPIVAGASKMHYNTFLLFNIVGGALWAAIFTYLGYFAGAILTGAGVNIEVTAIIIILISVAPMAIHALKQKSTRDKLRYQLSVLFSKGKRTKK